MKTRLSNFIFFIPFLFFCQNKYEALVVDSLSMEPLAFVSVFNTQHHTMTNADGRFSISSNLDSVLFYHPGYDKKTTTFQQLTDTIYLNKSVLKLDEVVVTNAKSIYQKIKDSIASNYLLQPHTENFFMRAVLRRNDSIVRLQDMQGQVHRKTSVYTGNLELAEKDFLVQVHHMRKVGIVKDQNSINFELPSLYEIYKETVRLNAMGPAFTVTEKPFEKTSHIQVDFSSNKNDSSSFTEGHYIINGKDNAILSFNANSVFYTKNKEQTYPYSNILNSNISVSFYKDPEAQKYFMNHAKRSTTVAVELKEVAKPILFQLDVILHTTSSFGTEKLKSNVNEHKDIFKFKIPYNKVFWDAQNQLLLTGEMQDFIIRIQSPSSKEKYKIKSNLD